MHSWNRISWQMERNLLEPETDKQPETYTNTDTAPWTTRQTFVGTLSTLIPWIALSLLLSSLNGTAAITKPLSPQADLIGAIVTIIFTVIIEGAFLIAPAYFANAAFRSITPHARLALQSLGFRRYRVGR